MKKFIAVLAVGFGVLLYQTSASAAFELRYTINGVGPTSVFDNPDVVNLTDFNPSSRHILAFPTDGTTSFTVTADVPNSLDALVLHIFPPTTNTTIWDLVVEASYTGFAVGPTSQTVNYDFSPLGGGAHTFETWVSYNDTLFGPKDETSGPKDGLPDPKELNGSFGFSDANTYSLTTRIHIIAGTAGSPPFAIFSADSNNRINAVPVPSGLVLIFAAIPMVGATWFFRRLRLQITG